jgi:segregation and condensation protein B
MKVDDKRLALLEAILFTTTDPLSMEKLMKLMRANKDRLEQMLTVLRERYAKEEYGVTLSEIGGFKLVVKPEFFENVSDLTPHADLSRGLLRVLAIIAYHEPIKQSDIVKVVGNRTYEYVKELEERGLIKVEKKSRTKLLTTTPHFEDYFGINKQQIKKEFEDLKKEEKEKGAEELEEV